MEVGDSDSVYYLPTGWFPFAQPCFLHDLQRMTYNNTVLFYVMNMWLIAYNRKSTLFAQHHASKGYIQLLVILSGFFIYFLSTFEIILMPAFIITIFQLNILPTWLIVKASCVFFWGHVFIFFSFKTSDLQIFRDSNFFQQCLEKVFTTLGLINTLPFQENTVFTFSPMVETVVNIHSIHFISLSCM